ncbi:MAG: AarF/UbiB family protein [Myxococcota bacterium]
MTNPGVLQAVRENVLRPIPRRTPLVEASAGPERLESREIWRPRASRWVVFRRFMAWMWSFTQYSWARTRDRLRGEDSLEQQGVRLREFFERLGAIAIKIGQQMAIRVDFLPPEICNELGRLMDHAPAFPVEVAIERIEATLGCPAEEVFDSIEPEPIGSASISVVWRGELVDGTVVAIKVRRPGVAELFAADLALVDVMTLMAEAMTAVRPGFFKNFRFEMRDMLMNELDFSQEADFQALFRRMVKRDRLRWVTAPRVFGELSGDEVMISEFAEGYPCIELLEAVENNDETKLREFAAAGIDPVKVGNRVQDLGFWMRLESFFFHADPHPGNIFVRRGSRLTLIDFGSCGIASSKQRICEFESGRRLAQRDIAGAANVALASLAPLPELDVERVRRMAWGAFWNRSLDIECGKAEWWERTTASVWLALFNSLSEFQLPINVDTLRLLRASLLTDTLAFRLNHDLDVNKAWNRWIKKAASRSKRRDRRRFYREERYFWPQRFNELGRGRELLERGAFWGDRFMRELPRAVASSVNRWSFTASLMLRMTLLGSIVALVVMSGALLYNWLSPTDVSVVDMAMGVMTHPMGAVLVLLLTSLGLVKIKAKLEEKGHK